MEITGRIIAVMPPRGGISQRTGNSWKTQDFVIETHEQYPKKCVFTVFGEDKLTQMNIQQGDELTVSFDIDAHEYNGRWFNDIRAWKVERVQAMQTVPPADTTGFPPGMSAPTIQAASPVFNEGNDPADDLPF